MSRDFLTFSQNNLIDQVLKKCLDNLLNLPYNIHIKIEKEKKKINKPITLGGKKI
jgi:hypothetical protein